MWGPVCDVYSPEAEGKRQRELNSIDTVVYMQKEVIKDAKNIKGFTDTDYNILNKALMVLESLKNNF